MTIHFPKINGFNGGSGGGSTATITLLSITTAPSGTFEKGSQYYNSTTRLIYTATADDVWGTDGETPKFNTIYIYDNNGTTEYYQWDGDNLVETDLEKYQLKSNITDSFSSSSQVTYPSSKALKDGLGTAKPNIYDIKLLSQAIADKGWACLSHTSRKDIAKASVPTLYENILIKYNNVEKAELPWTQGVGYNGDIDYHNGYLYYGEYNQIFRTNDPISTNFTLFAQLNSGTRTNTFRCFTNYMLVVGWNDIRVISYENGSYIAIPYSNSQDADITFKEIGDYIYVIASEHNKIMRIPNVSFSQITTNSLEEIIDCSQFNAGDICDILYSTTNSMWYLITYSRAYFYIHSTNDLFNINNYSLNIFSDHGYGNGLGKFIQTNNRICIFIIDSGSGSSRRITIFYTDDYFTTVNTTFLSSNLTSGYISYKDGNVYISGTCFYYDPWGNSRQFPELHIINTTTLTGITNSFGYAKNDGYSPGGATRIAFGDNDLFYIGYKDKTTSAVAIHYSGLAPVKYIDSYQINSNPVTTVDITYYKFNDWKICTPDITVNNDTNLNRVYEYLGYHNYWRIDTVNETISLPRNSNLWTMMYVGDDYQDSNLPSGSFAGIATKKEVRTKAETITIDTASITIAEIQANKNYIFSNNAITDITLSGYETSFEETTIEFATGSTAPTLTDNSGVTWVDASAPILNANKRYIILIFNKLAFVREY